MWRNTKKQFRIGPNEILNSEKVNLNLTLGVSIDDLKTLTNIEDLNLTLGVSIDDPKTLTNIEELVTKLFGREG